MTFKKDIEALERALHETEHRIKKLEEHKESINKELRDSKLNSKTNTETLRRLEHNLEDLYNKHILIIKELEE